MTNRNENFPTNLPSGQTRGSDIGNQSSEVDLFGGWFAD